MLFSAYLFVLKEEGDFQIKLNKMDKKFIIVSLEGNVGAGKSTLFEILRKEFPKAIFLMEPLESW